SGRLEAEINHEEENKMAKKGKRYAGADKNSIVYIYYYLLWTNDST
ncbi:UNVERIFIED_ORG: hypothetical protein QQG_0960, partial [Clostridioides difficile Y384]